MMEYNGYRATINYDPEDHILVGTVFGIKDSLNFHGNSVDELETSFHNCIDDYLEMCKEFGKEPDKEYKGQFNVRVAPELHRQVALAAEMDDISLNQFVVNALETAVHTRPASAHLSGH
jgi:predicted HicB family RNase H-like nuclease